jgi:hypothetical protein
VSAGLDVPRCEKCGRYPIDHRDGECIYPRASAELAARRTAAAAVLADYQRAAAGADVADRALWAGRLADMLALLLGQLGAQPAGPAEQLQEIRLVLEAFDWETDDRQYVLEQIDGIVKGDGQ